MRQDGKNSSNCLLTWATVNLSLTVYGQKKKKKIDQEAMFSMPFLIQNSSQHQVEKIERK